MNHNSWYRTENDGIAAFRALNLEQTGLVTNVFTTRIGGVSAPPFDTLNLGLHVQDDPSSVLENRRYIATALGVDPAAITCAEQVHGNVVAVVGEEDAGKGATRFDGCISGADALITNSPAPVLTLFFADCVPVMILDPVNRAIGLAHAGWKGTALRITEKMVEAMRQAYGTDPGRCLAAVGPSIGRCCYEVSLDVAEKVIAAARDDRVVAHLTGRGGRADLRTANWLMLQRSDIPDGNIALSPHCTCCTSQDFFSYRRDGSTGRMAAILALR